MAGIRSPEALSYQAAGSWGSEMSQGQNPKK
jgi:hypothetical protein